MSKIYDDGNVEHIGLGESVPLHFVSYAPGIDTEPTHFVVCKDMGKIFAYCGRGGKRLIDNFDKLAPTYGEEVEWIKANGQDVTDNFIMLAKKAKFYGGSK